MSGDDRIWRKLFRHESTDDRRWPVIVRAVRDHLLRLPDDTDGVIFTKTTAPVDDLLLVLSVHPDEAKAIRDAVVFLLKVGYLAMSGDSLVIANFEKYQSHGASKKTPAQRQAEYRARQKAKAEAVTKDNSVTSLSHNALRHPLRQEVEEEVDVVASSDGVTRTASRTEETPPDDKPKPPVPGSVEMTPDWQPSKSQVDNLMMGGGVTPDAAQVLAANFRSINMGKSDSPERWDRAFGRWAMAEWGRNRQAYRAPNGVEPMMVE